MRPFDPARLPPELPVLGVRGTVLFPGVTLALTLQSDEAVSAARAAEGAGGLLAVALRRSAVHDEPFHPIAALGAVIDLLGRAQARCRVIGLARVALDGVHTEGFHLRARVHLVPDVEAPDEPSRAQGPTRDHRLRAQLVGDGPDAFPELSLPALRALVRAPDRAELADRVLAHLPIAVADQQRGLAERSVETRLALASSLLDRAVADAAAHRRLADEPVRLIRLALWRAWRPRIG